MPDQGGVIPRRLLGIELKRLREKSGRKLEDLSRDLLISTSKISRLENGRGFPQIRDIRDLIRYYDIEGTDVAARMQKWTEESRKAPWWTGMAAALPPATAEYLAFESASSEIHAYVARFIPSLLQTREYASALIDKVNLPDSVDLATLTDVRIARQEIITRDDNPVITDLVIDESALLRRTGSDLIMHDQLNRLADMAEQAANVTLRVLELHSGPSWASYPGAFSVFRFPNGVHPDVANPELVEKYIDDPDQVSGYLDRFDALCEDALDLDRSILLLRRAARRYTRE